MSMVDGVGLVVDATDGPMTQTKYVLKKALGMGLKPFVIINKCDRPTARLGDVENEIFDLFVSLEANDEQMEYKVLYASAREGWAVRDKKNDERKNMEAIYETIVDIVPPPKANLAAPFQMLVTQIESDIYFGKCLIGRITSGVVRPGDLLKALDEEGKEIEQVKILKLLRRRGMNRFTIDEARAGDIVSIAGFSTATVNATLCHPSLNEVIPSVPIDPPTLSMNFLVNDSPLCGQEGTALTSNALKARLIKEAENNVSIKVLQGQGTDALEIRARGELQLGIIIETIRREKSELCISPPRVVFKRGPNGDVLEPMEEVNLDVDEEHSGKCIEKLSKRGGEMKEYIPLTDGRVRLIFHITTRGLLGYRNEFTNDTRGQGVFNHIYHSHIPWTGTVERSDKGALISMDSGICTSYALDALESRGILFVEPNDKVYAGMVIGENSRDADIEVNPVKQKALTNIRTVMKEDKVRLTPAKKMTLEEVISYVRDDEVIEVTPQSIRLRKRILESNLRKSQARKKGQGQILEEQMQATEITSAK
jgi:GTP-binding protein